jgi:HD-GYP domain-containing protein (c-di-GMP phosphodiesterase class II)
VPSNKSATSTRRPAARAARRPKEQPRLWAIPALSRAELTISFSRALDLAEGQEVGHAARACYIALSLAEGLGLSKQERSAVFFGSLLHDAGANRASNEVCRLLNLNEEALFANGPLKSPQQLGLELSHSEAPAIVEALRAHPKHGAEIAAELGFGEDVQEAIRAHHERWDGHGYPEAQQSEQIPITGRVVAAADLLECLIATEVNSLAARRTLPGDLAEHNGHILDPDITACARQLSRDDAFWLGLYSQNLPQELLARQPAGAAKNGGDLLTFANVFADLADEKGEHTLIHSRRTGQVAANIAEALGLDPDHQRLIEIAGLLHDVGLAGVPARIIAKPDILSLTEMQVMRQHPSYSQIIIESLPGMGEVSRWIGMHHERPDGKGYPEMLEKDDIPLEARILAIADTYVALTSRRPYRGALAPDDAFEVLLGAAGAQLDRDLVQVLCSIEAAVA